MRGQFETAAADDPAGYAVSALGADILAVMHATGARHLVVCMIARRSAPSSGAA